MPTMERILVYKPDAATSSSAIDETNKNAPASSDDDDSDDEIGRMIYNSSETAKARAAAAEATNNTNTLSNSLLTSGSKILLVEQKERVTRCKMSRLRRSTLARYVQLKGVATNQFKEECVESMAQNPRYADMRDVPTKSRKEEFV